MPQVTPTPEKFENHPQLAYTNKKRMKAIFVELPPFQRLREYYLDDDAFKGLQEEPMMKPEAKNDKAQFICRIDGRL